MAIEKLNNKMMKSRLSTEASDILAHKLKKGLSLVNHSVHHFQKHIISR